MNALLRRFKVLKTTLLELMKVLILWFVKSVYFFMRINIYSLMSH